MGKRGRRKQLEEEKRKRLEQEEAERKEREEKERIRKQKEEEIRRKKEEERKKHEEELKILQEKWKREEEIRRKKEQEEYEKERERQRLEEEKRKKEEEEKQRKIKEKMEKLKEVALQKMNKKEEDLTPNELKKLLHDIEIKAYLEQYESITFKEFSYNQEGKNIKYTLEEIKQISTEQVLNLEVTNTGKIVALTGKDTATITIYNENTYEIEKSENLKMKVNSFKIYGNKIYCALSKSNSKILIISLNNFDDKIYLDGHSCEVTDLTITSYGYLLSADEKGTIRVWKNNEYKKCINDFHTRINTISEINEGQQRIAILSFNEERVRLYDLRYTELYPLGSIYDIKGSGLQNNMLKLNNNMLAIAGTYMYIIDINSFMITNIIYCFYANDCISTSLSLIENTGFFFVGQAITNIWDDDLEKGTIGYYEYIFENPIIPDKNPLIKIASKNHCHESFISSIRKIGYDTIVSGAYDGKIKFWKIKNLI